MPSPTHRRSRRPALAAVLAALAGLALAACGGADGVHGTLEAAAAGDSSEPMTGGWVAILTADQAADFFAASAIDPPTDADLGFVQGRIRHEAVTDAGGSLSTVDDDGHFAVTVTGPHRLCVIRELPQVDLLRGCVTVDLPVDGDLTVTVTADEGTRAVLDD
jgi:hypothetical protein